MKTLTCNHMCISVFCWLAGSFLVAVSGVPAVGIGERPSIAPSVLTTRQPTEGMPRLRLSGEGVRLYKPRTVDNEPLKHWRAQQNSLDYEQQATLDSGSARTSQLTNYHNLHLTRRLVLTSNIHPITHNKTQGRQQQQHQQHRQQLQERVCLKIRAQLTPLQEPHHNDSSRQADSPGSIPSKSASYHICKPQPASKGHSLFRIAVPLLLPTSSRSTEAEHSNTPQPMLLTLHIEQHSGTRAYLWTGAKFVLPGASIVKVAVDMHDHHLSWLLQQPQGSQPAVSSKPAASTSHISNSTERLNSSSTAQSATELIADQDNTMSTKQVYLQQDSATTEQQQQQGSMITSSSAATWPSLMQRLTACTATTPTTSAYAAASILAASPLHAAWTAALLAQNSAAAETAKQQQQQGLFTHASQSRSGQDTDTTSRSNGKPGVCMAWPPAYDLQQLLGYTFASTDLHPAAAAEQAASTVALGAAARAAEKCSSSSSNNLDVYLMALWDLLEPYVQPYATFDEASHGLTITAPFEHVLLVLAGLVLATTIITAAFASCSSRRRSSRRNKQQILAANKQQVQTTVPCGPSLSEGLVNHHGPPMNEHHNNVVQEMTNSSRPGGREVQPAQQPGDLVLFGRSALDQLGQQQQLDAFGELDQDDYIFGYTGAAAVRRASAAAAGQATGLVKAALGKQPTAGGGNSLLSPNQIAAGRNAAAAVGHPSTAAKLAAGYWDTADEDAVNQLPASVQERLQAGGKWTRAAAGGRLIRSSLKAVRAASNRAAAAVVAAVSGGHHAAAAGGGGYGLWQQQQGGLGSGSGRDADLLRRLVAAEPGTEMGLSDDEE